MKCYLERLELDEVSVTSRTRDGGIDLTAVRPGVGSFNHNDAVNYYVQAKKYAPNSVVSVNKIRELKGVLPAGYKGIFITTARFSRDAVMEVETDPSRLIILVNGKELVQSCIEYGIGFVFVPRFSSESLSELMRNEDRESLHSESECVLEESSLEVTKNITLNDIRVRILSIPRKIFDKLDESVSKKELTINGIRYELAINRDRKYFGGVTAIYRNLNLMTADGVFQPTTAIWKYNNGEIEVQIQGR